MAFLRKIPLALFLLIQVCAAVEHNLPEGLEIVDPRSLGLAGADLDKFLGNVKLLPVSGNGLPTKDGPKTQILTVGFEGDEGINLDDFELPSVDNLPDSEKTVAQAAFSRFKDFFKDPSKSKTIVHDEDLLEDPLNSDIKKIVTTTPSSTSSATLTTTTTAPTRSRTVYRPRTTTPLPKTTRIRKIKRPASFRRITTTTPTPFATELPDEYLQGITGGNNKGTLEFQPEQFQDYAKIIKDLQKMGPRVQTSREVDEGAPIGLLGFKQVNEPGHKGPPIFEFGSSSPTKSKPKPLVAPTTTRPPYTYTRGTTTKKPNTGFPPQTRYLSNRPHGNSQISSPTTPYTGSPNRFSTTPQLTKTADYQNSNSNNPSGQSEEQSESKEQGTKTNFEQISAQPVGSDHHTSFRVPFRFPGDEDKQTQYEQIYEQHLLTQGPPQHQQQQQQPAALRQVISLQPQPQIIRPTILTSVPSQSHNQYTQQSVLSSFPTLPQPSQLEIIQQQYQRQQQEQQRRLQQLTEQLKLQQQKSQQLQQQLKIQTQQQQQNSQYQFAPSPYSQNPQQSNGASYSQAQSQQSVQSQINYQPQGFNQQPSRFHDHQHHHFRQSPIPVNNANTIRPEINVQPQNQNYFRPSLADKFTLHPAEEPKHVVQNPVNLYDHRSPQIIPLSTIENAVRPNTYSPNRFALPPNHQRHHQQQPHQAPQSSYLVNNNYSQRPNGSPLNHSSHQFSIRSSENAEARTLDKGPLITPAALIGTFSLAPQISQKVTHTL